MKKLLLILLFSSSLFSQQTSQSGYWTAVMGDSIGANRTSQSKAQADATILKLNYPDSIVRVIPPPYWTVSLDYEPEHIIDSIFVDVPYFVHDTVYTVRPPQIDTIKKIGRVVYRDYTNSLTQPTVSPLTYVLLHDIGVVEIFADTIYSWQRVFNIERVKFYSQTFYRNLEVPFHVTKIQIADITSTSVIIHIWFNDDSFSELFAEYTEIGTSNTLRTNTGLLNVVSAELLKPNTEYSFQISAKNIDNQDYISDIYYFKTI